MDLTTLIEKAKHGADLYARRTGSDVRVDHFPNIHRFEITISKGDQFNQFRIDTDCIKVQSRFEELFQILKTEQ